MRPPSRASSGASSPSPATHRSPPTTPASTSGSWSGSCSGCTAGGWPSRPSARPRSPGGCSKDACAASASASLADFFGVPTRPCHRALPDAESTAQVLVRLIGLAQEVGARRVSDLRKLAAPRKRRVYGKRPLVRGAPSRPGVYLFRDRSDQVLYVGRARDLRARLRSYFRSERQRPVGRGGAARARANRVACARLRARSCARGAAADPRAAASGQLAQPASRARRLPHASRRRLRRHQDGDRARPDPEPPARRAGRSGARGRDAGRARPSPRGRPTAASPSAARAARRRLPLRGGSTAARPDRRPRARRRAPAPAQGAAQTRALPDRPCARARLAEGVLRLRRRSLRRSLTAPGRGREAADRRGAGALSVAPAAGPPARSRPNRQKTSCCSTASFAARRRSSPCCRSSGSGSGPISVPSLGSGRAFRRGRPGRVRAPGVAARRGRRSAPSRPRARARHWPASRRACGGAPQPDRRRISAASAARRGAGAGRTRRAPRPRSAPTAVATCNRCYSAQPNFSPRPVPTRPGPAPKGAAA